VTLESPSSVTKFKSQAACAFHFMCKHTVVKTRCDLNLIVKGEGLLWFTGSHVHWKSDNGPTPDTVLDGDVAKASAELLVTVVVRLLCVF